MCSALLLIVACSSKTTDPAKAEVSRAPEKTFTIALLPEQNVFEQKRRYKLLAEYLSRSLGMNVKTKLLDSYDAIYNEMVNKRVDGAVFGSLSYVVMNSKIPLDPIARPLQKDGTSTYKGLIFTLRNRGITGDVRTWRGKRIALVNKFTTAGYIFPRWYLYKRGVKDFGSYFSKIVYTGSHDAAVLSVFQNEADIGCASDRIFNEVIKKNPLMHEKLIVIANSAPVPSNTFGIRESVGSGVAERLKDVFLNMDKTPGGRDALSMLGAARFIETRESEFEPISEMLNPLGLKPEDLALEFIGRNVPTGQLKRVKEQ
jgi:phosphonate transport system substrate-binding protein